jgi:DNA repair exonuclease SbcCD ATPase subunit
MIVFETLRWKNFLSTGNNFIELDLVKSPSTLVLGRNGAGKSTMLDALCFSLFNKPFRLVKKGQLVNSVNEKECVVEVEFKIGSVHYKVVRGIKPNVFEIYRNGSLIDQDAANNDYQKYLEQSILKLNYKSFTQVVILGSSTFVPFMQLSAPHRREVIEDLLDIQVFSRMNAILKDRVKDTKEEINECNHQLQLAQKEVDLKTRFIEQLEAQSGKYAQEKREKIAANQQRLSAIKNEDRRTRTTGVESS